MGVRHYRLEASIPAEFIERKICLIRGHKVMLDGDLAKLYEVPTKALNQAVQRNLQRFPADFMFQLTAKEAAVLRSQSVTSSRGGRRYLPYVFTEQGVAMLSSVLKSGRAVQVNVAIMRVFVKIRSLLASQDELLRRLDELEQRNDDRFRIVFEAIEQLLAPEPVPPKNRIGFSPVGGKKRQDQRPTSSLR
jgi:hypothetical protein